MTALPWLAAVVIATSALAWWRRPRCSMSSGLPWPWLALWLLLPLLWSPDRWSGVALWPPASGAVLSVLLAGWPLTVLALAVSALLTVVDGSLGWAEALQRWFWLGTLPATLTVALGGLLARWPLMPTLRQDAVLQAVGFLAGRAFIGTLMVVGIAAAGTHQPVAAAALLAFAEAALTTLLIAGLLAWQPGWVHGWAGASRSAIA
jgi:hypothetical protein